MVGGEELEKETVEKGCVLCSEELENENVERGCVVKSQRMKLLYCTVSSPDPTESPRE